MVFLLHVGRLPLAISQIVSRNRILCEVAFKLTTVQCWRWTPTMVCAVTTPLHSLYQSSLLCGPGPNSTYEAISPGRKTHFANNEETIHLRKMY